MTLDKARIAVALAGFCAFLDLYATQSVLPELSERFHVTPAEAGATVGVTTLAVAGSAPFVGMLADRLGHRRTMVGAALILVVPTVLLAFAGSLDEILLWRFVQGLAIPAIFSSAVALTSELWPATEAADVTGLYLFGSVLGGFSGRFFTALIADRFGWAAGFLLLAAVTLAAAAIFRLWLPARPARATAARKPAALAALLGHLRNPPLLGTCAVGATVLFANVAVFTYVNFHLAEPPFSLSQTALGAIFAVYLIGAPATPVSGRLIRRLGRRGIAALSAAIGSIGLAITLIPWLPAIVIGLGLFVTGVFVAQAASLGFIGLAVRQARSTAVGLYICCYYLAGSLGAVLPGALWLRAGWPGCVALVVAILAVGAAIASRAWKEPIRPR